MTDQTAKNKDLIDRYVAAVGRRLPAKESSDITAELREAVSSRLEAKEAELNRTADKAEMAAILKSFGSPMLAAARYSGQQYLIGPDLFPYFWPVTRIVVGIVAAISIVGFLVRGVLSDNPMRHALQGIAAAWNGSLFAFGVVTVVFIVMEQTKSGAKIEQSWRPEQLPQDTQNKPKSLFESLFALAWDAIFIAWWVGLLHFPNALPGTPSRQGITLDFNAAAWAAVYMPVLVMSVMQAVIHVSDVFHPTWSRVRALAAIAVGAIGLWVVWMLAQIQASDGQLFAIHGPADVADRVAELNQSFAIVSQIMLFGLAIGFGIALVVDAWRLVRSFQISVPRPEALPKG